MKLKSKSKFYNASLTYFAVTNCNLRCKYCVDEQYLKNLNHFSQNVDIAALLRTLKKSSKTYRIIFVSLGETFLIPNLIEACQEISKEHYVSVISNFTHPKVKEFARKINPERVITIKASAHLAELKRKNLLEVFFDNFYSFKNYGFPVFASAVAYPALSNDLDEYKKMFDERGLDLVFDPFIGNYNNKAYPQSYSKEELEIFNIDTSIHFQKDKICNAGYNTAIVSPSGSIVTCAHISKEIGHIDDSKIEFNKKLIKCPVKVCICPLNNDLFLLNQAIYQAAPVYKKIANYLKSYYLVFDRMVGKLGIILNNHFPALYFYLKKVKSL